jgi:DNA-binding beta-propeller fold protein YncE
MQREGDMAGHELIVALGERRYRVERPWGALPQGPGKVTDVAVDGEGRVHVLLRSDPLVDAPSDAVVVLAADGTRIGAWGAGLIADAHMLATAPDGRVFVVDRDAHEVVICDRDGQRIGGLGSRNTPHAPFNHPTDVAISAAGEIYVCEGYAAGTVHRFASDGRRIGAWGAIGNAPGEFMNAHAVWLQPDGRVVVADRDNNRLQIFTADGDLLGMVGGFRQPMDIWGDAEGQLFVTDLLPSLTMLAPDGAFIGRCRPVLNGAHGIWGAPDGALLLAEGNPSRVTRLVRIA